MRPGHPLVPGIEVEEVDDASGTRFSLLTAVPVGSPPDGGYPVLVLLDAGAHMATLVEMMRLRRNRPAMTGIETALVVGIAHPGAHPWDRTRRAHEYAAGPEGGAGAFVDLMADIVLPRVEAAWPVDRARTTLIGHSLAGAFTLYAFATRPEAFNGYLAISPSIWTLRRELDRGLDGLESASPPDTVRHLWIGVAEYDQAIAPWQESAPDQDALRRRRAERAMVDEAERIAGRIRTLGPGWARTHFEVIPGEDHASVVPVAMSRALRYFVERRDRG